MVGCNYLLYDDEQLTCFPLGSS